MMHPHGHWDADVPIDETPARRVARATARTVPWAMGTLAAGLRERGGIYPSQFKMLMSMRGGGVTPSDLAERMEVSLPTVSKTISVLERHGWIERTDDAGDRRRTLLNVTDEGRAAVRAFMDDGVDQMAQVFDSASDGELEAIERGMDSLLEVLKRTYAGRSCRHGRAEGGDAR